MDAMLIALPDPALLQFTGPDSERLLQGQVTCNMSQLHARCALPGAYCTPQGRVIADFLALRVDEQILLRCEPGMASLLQAALAKYAAFFNSTMTIINSDWQRHALLGSDAEQQLSLTLQQSLPTQPWQCLSSDNALVIRLPGPDQRFELLTPISHQLISTLASRCPNGEPYHWQLAEMRSGLYPLPASESQQYTPQLLNHDLLGYVDFRKGCYTGQEIIARMHYRGKVKRRLHTLRTITPVTDEFPASRLLYVTRADDAAKVLAQPLRVARDDAHHIWLQAIVDCSLIEQSRAGETTLAITAQESVMAQLEVIAP